mmetsp:Transcript_10983/g.37282  ORF Transcript_10983/g.37282 Transcript_10983/m.37282 type:complete len:207 (-) Transcript_10983:92-712(-)
MEDEGDGGGARWSDAPRERRGRLVVPWPIRHHPLQAVDRPCPSPAAVVHPRRPRIDGLEALSPHRVVRRHPHSHVPRRAHKRPRHRRPRQARKLRGGGAGGVAALVDVHVVVAVLHVQLGEDEGDARGAGGSQDPAAGGAVAVEPDPVGETAVVGLEGDGGGGGAGVSVVGGLRAPASKEACLSIGGEGDLEDAGRGSDERYRRRA